MTFDDLSQWTSQLGAGEKLAAPTKRRIEVELPASFEIWTPHLLHHGCDCPPVNF